MILIVEQNIVILKRNNGDNNNKPNKPNKPIYKNFIFLF